MCFCTRVAYAAENLWSQRAHRRRPQMGREARTAPGATCKSGNCDVLAIFFQYICFSVFEPTLKFRVRCSAILCILLHWFSVRRPCEKLMLRSTETGVGKMSEQLLWQSCEWWWVWKFFHGDVEVPLVARALLRVRTDVWNSESLQRAKSGSNTVAFVLCEKYFVQQTPPLKSKTQTPLKSNASKKQSEQTEAFLETKQEPISVVIFLSTRWYFCVPALSNKNNNYYCYCSKDPFIYKIYNYTNADAIRNELILRADRDLKVKRDPL